MAPRTASLVAALLAWGIASSACAATVYRWVDGQGRTHFGDAVPSEYKSVATALDVPDAAPAAREQLRVPERALEQKKRALVGPALKNPGSLGAGAAIRLAPSPSSGALKRPPLAPTENTDCETWRDLHRQSLDCFGPYRTAASQSKGFEHCRSVVEPPPRCGANAP